MLRIALIAIVVTGLCACADGWPRVHHPVARSAAANCTPTGSKISRNDCATATPGSSASAEDLDRARQQSGGAAVPTLSPH
jgi:hypothetical protein